MRNVLRGFHSQFLEFSILFQTGVDELSALDIGYASFSKIIAFTSKDLRMIPTSILLRRTVVTALFVPTEKNLGELKLSFYSSHFFKTKVLHANEISVLPILTISHYFYNSFPHVRNSMLDQGRIGSGP